MVPNVREVILRDKMLKLTWMQAEVRGMLDYWRNSINSIGFKLTLPPNQLPKEGGIPTRR
jgi:hypothetical protein